MNWETSGTGETGGTGETSGMSGTGETGETGETSGMGGTGETSRKVYTKEIAKCVYEQLNKSTNVEETLKILAEKMNNNQFTE